MDRVVQKAIEMVLVAIYEPIFEKRNRSFGFRPNKGVHDAMAALTSPWANAMRTAIEGEIEAAYDTVVKQKLLDILGKRIKDQRFLRLMKQRLQYSFYDTELKKVVKPELGIPQGGIHRICLTFT
jgi:retron-type reverse transcriptase